MEKSEFIERLVAVRMDKGVSARDLSLSMGQSPSYINNIETGRSLPSLNGFFYMCECLGITPKEFFDIETVSPTKTHELVDEIKSLDVEQIDSLIKIAKIIKKQK